MKKALVLLVTLSIILTGCATVGQDNTVGTPEVLILNKKIDVVKSKLIYRLSTANPSWAIKTQSSNTLIFTRPCGAAFSCSLTQALIGNSYSTPLQLDLSFTLIEDAENVKVLAMGYDAWTQMPGGQVNTQSVFNGNKKVLQQSLDDFASKME